MRDTMCGRGPDASGMHHQSNIVLGHRRLKIIDLSEQAQQPMVDAHLGLTIVFNGCIYNYKDLRPELEELGYRFFSDGDTEVVLKAYHAWGKKALDRLNGMFAFAIYERDSGRMFLARDRLGIKPLYYTDARGVFRFASSLPALLTAGGVDTSIDPVALHNYMSFHSVVPPPRTIIQGVRKLPQATYMVIEPDGKKSEHRYWDVTFKPYADDEKRDKQDWCDLVLATLLSSVKRRLVADVPVGVLLSGGVDSSVIVGLLSEAGQKDLHTFSIGFEAVGEEKGDEFQYSDIIARDFQTHHHKIFIDSSCVLPELDNCVKAMSEPMVSHDVIGFYLLSKEVSKHIRVVQSGQGADEIFGGYHWYPSMMNSASPVEDYARVFCDRDHEEYKRAVNADLVSDDFTRQFIEEQFSRPGADHPVDKALRMDGTVMIVDDPVKRVDNTSMSWGLEARVPFLDHEVVELAARVPAKYKIKGEGKYILKEAARKVIASEVIDRPKGYFPVPALKLLRGPYLEKVRSILHAPAAKQRGLFQEDYVNMLLKSPENHITPLRGSKLWQIALLEYWLQSHEI